MTTRYVHAWVLAQGLNGLPDDDDEDLDSNVNENIERCDDSADTAMTQGLHGDDDDDDPDSNINENIERCDHNADTDTGDYNGNAETPESEDGDGFEDDPSDND